MRRTHLLLAGLGVAGVAVLVAGNGPSEPAAVAGSSLDSPADEIARFANLAAESEDPLPRIDPAAAAAPLTLDTVDLDKITRDGDHYIAPLPDGRTARLTLDPELQTLAEKLLDESRAPKGAIVAMATDGRILALAGRRTAEPKGGTTGTFDWRLATEVWAPAASVFKLVTASALVDAGVDPEGSVCFHGGLRSVLEHNLHDDRRDSRCETLAYGVAHSQNAILGKLAFQNLEPTKLEAAAKALGWIDPLAHLRGTVGELDLPATKDLEFARAAAGFRGARLSVLGGAVLASTFADAGEQPMPHLIAAIDGVAIVGPTKHRAITAETATAVAKMMAGTCDSGSAAKTFNRRRKVRVAGKTGTLTRTDPFYIEHSWFVGFAPADSPELVVSVLLGNSESWHLRGHEAAKRMIDRALAPAKSARASGPNRTIAAN